MSGHYDCLIIGGGHAGAQAAISLRQAKFTGSIGLLSSELDLPYERPPLSKDYLLGSKSIEEIRMRPPQFWAERSIDIHLGGHVDRLDGSAHVVECADGLRFTYGRAIWATGGVPRTLSLPGASAQGVHTIRTRGDVDAIRTGLETARSVVIIGGGFVGLEAAAALRSLGKSVTVLETASRLMARVCGHAISDFYLSAHSRDGVSIRLNARVAAIETAFDRVAAIRLADGTRLPAEMVLIGIGILPSISPLLSAGAVGEIGVDVDDHCRVSLPDVYGIGDCARHPNPHAKGKMIRLESVQNATDQAAAVAKTIAGIPTPYCSLPWFWSKQYDLMLQTVGLALDYDQVVLRGDPAARSFSAIYLRDGYVQALDCVNAAGDFLQGKRLITSGQRVDSARLEDPAVKLRSFVSAV